MEGLSQVWSVRQAPDSRKGLYEKGEARVRVEGELTECFEMWQGVRQGYPLSPCLFTVY